MYPEFIFWTVEETFWPKSSTKKAIQTTSTSTTRNQLLSSLWKKPWTLLRLNLGHHSGRSFEYKKHRYNVTKYLRRNFVNLHYIENVLYPLTIANRPDLFSARKLGRFAKTRVFLLEFLSFFTRVLGYTDNALSSALLSSGKALSSGQNPASRQILFSKSSQ